MGLLKKVTRGVGKVITAAHKLDKKFGKGLERAGKGLLKSLPITSDIMHNKASMKNMKATSALMHGMIQREGQAADAERSRIQGERDSANMKLRASQGKANRRRVKGGLFGDPSVDMNISPRLG